MIIGHRSQWQFLKKSAELGRLAHAYLFYGPEQLGKKTLAIEFAKFLNCQNPADFILVEPRNKEIQISQIRDLIYKLSLRPYSAPLKTAIIDQAHTMNQATQNCFLKTLEEPADKTLLILITKSPERLLPTILSRVQKVRFAPIIKSEIEKYLKNQGLSQDKVQELALFSAGRPGTAIEFLSNPQKLENQKRFISDLIKISNSPLSFRFQYAKEIAQEPQSLKEVLEIWLRYFRSLLFQKADKNKQGSNFPLFDKYSLAKLKNILEVLEKTNFLLFSTNINPRLALEMLFLNL